jgi:predicted regulator of Ras-like GTPase activity (Roadblock/LC7/MglB family)
VSNVRQQAQATLDAMLSKGLVGAGLIGRDGLPLLLRFTRPVQEETFSAMAAALLGASEAAMQELAPAAAVTTTIETAALRLAATGVDDTHILVLAAPTAVPADSLSVALATGRKNLQALLRG